MDSENVAPPLPSVGKSPEKRSREANQNCDREFDPSIIETREDCLIYLSPPTKEDYPTLYSWFSDLSETHLWTAARSSMPFDEFVGELVKRTQNTIVILARERDGRPVAFFQLYDLSPFDGTAAFLVYLDKHYRNSAHGSLATNEFLFYVFRTYALRKIYADVYEFNQHSALLLVAGGWREEGRLRQHIWWRDRYWDQIRLSCGRRTFEELATRLLGPWADGIGRRAPAGFSRAEAQELYMLVVRAAGPVAAGKSNQEAREAPMLSHSRPFGPVSVASDDERDFIEMVYRDRTEYSKEEGWPRLHIWTRDDWRRFLVPNGHRLNVLRDEKGNVLSGLVSRDEHFRGRMSKRIWAWASDSKLAPRLRAEAESRAWVECASAAQEQMISTLFVYVITGTPRSSRVSKLLGAEPETVFDRTAVITVNTEAALKALRTQA
jgi:RimJ/RimL family protein N-acetyltransferase